MILAKLWWRLRREARKPWVRIGLIAALAFVTAGLAEPLGQILPETFTVRIDEAATESLLGILASSMLAVTTFSLSVMVAAHHAGASQATPRAHRLLREDGRTQTSLATFLGAFVFSLASIALLNAGVFESRDYALVYAMTILVFVLVVVAIVRWIEHLASLGAMETTTERVEVATRNALHRRQDLLRLGAAAQPERLPEGAWQVPAERFGHVQMIDLPALNATAESWSARIHIAAPPGAWIHTGRVLAHVEGHKPSRSEAAHLCAAFSIGVSRDFEQDPDYGIGVLAEIAQRALSPGLNDPQTACDVIRRQTALLWNWKSETAAPEPEDATYPRVTLPPLEAADLASTAFDAVARDAGAMAEVHLCLQQSLAALASHPDPEMRAAATGLARRALARADRDLALDEDKDRVRAAAPST